MFLSLEEESLRNEKRNRWISENPRFTSYCTHTYSHACTISHAIVACVDVRARDCQESQEETNEKRAAGLGSYVRHVWVLDYIYIPMPPRAW